MAWGWQNFHPQLAEAERSPMTTVKNDAAETARDQFGESANHALRVGELKFGSRFADRRYLAFVHEHNNSSTPMSR